MRFLFTEPMLLALGLPNIPYPTLQSTLPPPGTGPTAEDFGLKAAPGSSKARLYGIER